MDSCSTVAVYLPCLLRHLPSDRHTLRVKEMAHSLQILTLHSVLGHRMWPEISGFSKLYLVTLKGLPQSLMCKTLTCPPFFTGLHPVYWQRTSYCMHTEGKSLVSRRYQGVYLSYFWLQMSVFSLFQTILTTKTFSCFFVKCHKFQTENLK